MSYATMDHAEWVESNLSAGKRLAEGRKPKRNGYGEVIGYASAPDKLSPFQVRLMDILGIVGGGIYNAPIAWETVVSLCIDLFTFGFPFHLSLDALKHQLALADIFVRGVPGQSHFSQHIFGAQSRVFPVVLVGLRPRFRVRRALRCCSLHAVLSRLPAATFNARDGEYLVAVQRLECGAPQLGRSFDLGEFNLASRQHGEACDIDHLADARLSGLPQHRCPVDHVGSLVRLARAGIQNVAVDRHIRPARHILREQRFLPLNRPSRSNVGNVGFGKHLPWSVRNRVDTLL